MPAVPDYISALTSWIVGLLTANAFITGPPGTGLNLKANNIVSFLGGIPYPEKVTLQAGDRPYFTIDVPTQRVINRNSMATFSNARSAIGDVVEIKELTFEITVEWNNLDRNQANQFQTVAEAILTANPTLGFTAIPIRTSGQFTATLAEKASSADNNKSRKILVQTIRFPVVVELHRVQLVANVAYNGQ